jgi:hypothetical protein
MCVDQTNRRALSKDGCAWARNSSGAEETGTRSVVSTSNCALGNPARVAHRAGTIHHNAANPLPSQDNCAKALT